METNRLFYSQFNSPKNTQTEMVLFRERSIKEEFKFLILDPNLEINYEFEVIEDEEKIENVKPHELILLASSHKNYNSNFIDDLLYTFEFFMTVRELLSAILKRFFSSINPQSKSFAEKSTFIKITRMRCLVLILNLWKVRKHYFRRKAAREELLLEVLYIIFIKNVGNSSITNSVGKILDTMMANDEQSISKYFIFGKSDSLLGKNRILKQMRELLFKNMNIFIEQWTLFDQYQFQRVDVSHMISYVKDKSKNEYLKALFWSFENFQNIIQFLMWNKNVSIFLKNLEKGYELLERLIEIRNFNSSMVVYLVLFKFILTHKSIVSQGFQNKIKNLELFSPSRNWKNLRDLQENFKNKETIPVLSIFFKNLEMNFSLIPKLDNLSLISYERIKSIKDCLKCFDLMKSNRYKFKPVKEIQELIYKLPKFTFNI